MASFNLGPEEFKHLELLRVRLQQLTNSLGSMGGSIMTANPLPTAESLQAQAVILQHNLQSLQTIMNENSALFQRIVVHPSTNYPGRSQEQLLAQLLRKKPELDVESWIEEGRAAALRAGLTPAMLGSRAGDHRGGGSRDDPDDDDYDDDDEPADPFNEQWADILQVCRDGIKEYVQTDAQRPYTRDEYGMGVQNVRTGLSRGLEDDEEEDEEEDEEDEEDEDEEAEGRGQGHRSAATEMGSGSQSTRPAGSGGSGGGGGAGLDAAPQPEHALWFLARGDTGLSPLNTNITFESQRRAAKEASGRQQR